jgi:hypothetical protein
MIGLSGLFFGSVASKELRGLFDFARASIARKVRSNPREGLGKLVAIEGVRRTAWRGHMAGKAGVNLADLAKLL